MAMPLWLDDSDESSGTARCSTGTRFYGRRIRPDERCASSMSSGGMNSSPTTSRDNRDIMGSVSVLRFG